VIPVLSTDPEAPFPAIDTALEYPRGLLAAGGDLSPERLVNAYRHGIFPWYSEGDPILWWSPVPRCVLFPGRVHISRRLRRHYNQGNFRVTADQAFKLVIAACAEKRADNAGTWISDDMRVAYIRLHERGVAHSVEVWKDDKLVGGIYGLALGSVFFGESMFSRVTDASKVALVALCQQLQQWNYSLLDCQISNPHLNSMGAEELSRTEFKRQLRNTGKADHWKDTFTLTSRW